MKCGSVVFLAMVMVAAMGAEGGSRATVVPVQGAPAAPAISLVSTGEGVHSVPLVAEKTAAAPAKPAAPAAKAEAPKPVHKALSEEHKDAQVALAVDSESEAHVSETEMAQQEEQLASQNGWTWGGSADVSTSNSGDNNNNNNNNAANVEAQRRYADRQTKLSRRAARRAWMMLRFRTRCPLGAAGDNCRAVRRARWRLYKQARRRYMRLQWKSYGTVVKRRCRGPWTSRCPDGDAGAICKRKRRRWRSRCRLIAWSRRRRSCRGPWTTSCPTDNSQSAAACKRTRRNFRRRCRLRKNLRRYRRGMNSGNSRIAKFRARLLNSRSSYLVAHKRVRLIYIGRNRVLEWRPKTGFFQIFKVHRRSMNRVSSRALWRKRERIVFGRWAKLVKPWRLLYIGKNRLLAHNSQTGRYRIYRVRFSVTGNDNPLLLKSKGTWRRARRRRILYLGGRRLVTWRRRTGRYMVWKVNRKILGENQPGVFTRITTSSSWLFSRRKAKYAYIGRGTILQWHHASYRLINFRRRARESQPAFRYIKGGHMNVAMRRAWPFRSGHPNVHMTYLGGKLLLFYRTKRSSRVGQSGRKLRRITLFPFKIIALNNPRFNPVAQAPNLVNRPWDTNANWAQSAAYKPWLNDPKYCVRYNAWEPSGKIEFSRRGEVSQLSATGSRRNVITRVGRLLLQWSPYTGSYRVLRYNRAAKMFTQRSFGVFPNFKRGWRIVAFGKNRLLTYNSATREYVLYPVDGYQIRSPIAQGSLNLRRGYRLYPLGRRQVLAWRRRTGQWRVYRVNPDVTGVNVSPLRRMIAGGQWCDIRVGSTIMPLSSRNILVINKRTGEYSLYRFNPWAKGRRGNVFKKVLARGTWADPFLNGRTRLLALKGSRIMGWQPRRGGALYTVWYVGYEDGGSAAGGSTGPLGSVSAELQKLVSTIKNMKRFVRLRGKNIDPTLRLLAKPTYGGLKYRDLKQMFKSYLSDVQVPFNWKSTLKYFKNQQQLRARGLGPVPPEESDGANPTGVKNAIYGLGTSQTNPLQEQPPVMNNVATTSQNAQAISGAPSLRSNYPVLPKGPQNFQDDNDIWPDGDGMPTAEMVNGVSVPAPGAVDKRGRLRFPDGTTTRSTDDVFDDGSGPVPGSTVPQQKNPLASKVDILLEKSPIEYPQFPQDPDPVSPWELPAFTEAGAQGIPMTVNDYINGMGRSKFLGTIDDTKEQYNNIPDYKSPHFLDDSMQTDDTTSVGMTHWERTVPGSTTDGPGRQIDDGVFSKADKPDPVGDDMASTTTVYPANLKDYVGRRDKLHGMIVPGDGEAPLNVVH